jgi:hypothetical protein
VLYALVPFPLARLGADVLGGLYESYVDDIDRDRLGQFYTPRAVVRFMLDRAGFTGPEGIFRIEGDERHERRIFDFATGSGGFLVEAARRVIDEGGLDLSELRDLRDGLRAIVRGFHGCEISPFPYYLTEVNLLLQVSRLLGRLREVGQEPATFTLGVVHTDSLGARRGPGDSFVGLDPAHRADVALLASDERYGIVPLDAEKEPRFARDPPRRGVRPRDRQPAVRSPNRAIRCSSIGSVRSLAGAMTTAAGAITTTTSSRWRLRRLRPAGAYASSRLPAG